MEAPYFFEEAERDIPWPIGSEEVDRDWRSVMLILPPGWKEEAVAKGAVRRRLREFKDIEAVLRVLLIHLSEGCSLRATVARAKAGGLANVSDVALLQRLRRCGAWFQWMVQQLVARTQRVVQPRPILAGKRIRLIDGSVVSEPGETGSTWRIHYSMNLDTLGCDEVMVTDIKKGESLTHFEVAPGDLLMADRGFGNRRGIRHVVERQGEVLLRINLSNLPLEDTDGAPFELLPRLRTLSTGEAGDWQAQMRDEQGTIPLRVCAYKKTDAQARAAQAQVEREAKKHHRQLRPDTREGAGYVVVVSTLREPTAEQIMELYRHRWQVELAFKRLKSLLQLGHLKKTDPEGAKAWLQGKLLVACLIETLIQTAEHFSPWGYPGAPTNEAALPLA